MSRDELKDYGVELKFIFKVNTKRLPWWVIKEFVATMEAELMKFNRDTLTSSSIEMTSIESNVGDYVDDDVVPKQEERDEY